MRHRRQEFTVRYRSNLSLDSTFPTSAQHRAVAGGDADNLKFRDMPEYCIHKMILNIIIAPAVVETFATDEVAIERGRQMLKSEHDVEIWTGARCVTRLKADRARRRCLCKSKQRAAVPEMLAAHETATHYTRQSRL